MVFRNMSPSDATGNFPAAPYPALHQRHWPSRRDKHLGLAFNLTLRSWCGGVFRGLTALDCLLPCSIRLFQLHAHGSVVEDAICGSRFQTEAASYPQRQRSTCGVEEPVARGTRITRPSGAGVLVWWSQENAKDCIPFFLSCAMLKNTRARSGTKLFLIVAVQSNHAQNPRRQGRLRPWWANRWRKAEKSGSECTGQPARR